MTDRSALCGCKGIRTCLKCEELFGFINKNSEVKQVENSYVYCPYCDKCWSGWEWESYSSHPNHSGDSFILNGLFVKLNFISEEEEQQLIEDLDKLPWDPSQSGRRKQNFGPKCNFKKKKLRVGDFKGFPKCTSFLQEKFKNEEILKDYICIEQCSLEYDPDRGASIDPHIDDCWVWGERIITVNLLSDSVLTLKPYNGDEKRYNLPLAPKQYIENKTSVNEDIIVRVPMPRRSLIVMYGEARYKWEHLIYREDITKRRVCLAYREFTPVYLPGGELESEAYEILQNSKLLLD